ncbi:hypothetical protein TELCIR_02424 [Teladorsagia circumcincta]|uniref:Uncharacterized protein n=1 Tax=Teladorsagia circumcincta TaxID=45464 RepID=A0A2G9UZ84_TELCI|nr:hypothetical protein TELCIR_02424 [Teladorsagia circumcincta]
MLRWIAGVTRLDHIRNDVIRERFGVAPIVDKMREARLRWRVRVSAAAKKRVVDKQRGVAIALAESLKDCVPDLNRIMAVGIDTKEDWATLFTAGRTPEKGEFYLTLDDAIKS